MHSKRKAYMPYGEKIFTAGKAMGKYGVRMRLAANGHIEPCGKLYTFMVFKSK
jgi:hypothetical protein